MIDTNIDIRIDTPKEATCLELSVPRSLDIEEMRDVLVTILTHLGYHYTSILEILPEER